MFDLQKLLVDIEADNIGMHAYQRGGENHPKSSANEGCIYRNVN